MKPPWWPVMILNCALPLLFRTSGSPASATFHNRTLSFDALGISHLSRVFFRIKKWKLTILYVGYPGTPQRKKRLLNFEGSGELLGDEAYLGNRIVGHPICRLCRFDGLRRSVHRLRTNTPMSIKRSLVSNEAFNMIGFVLKHTMVVFYRP